MRNRIIHLGIGALLVLGYFAGLPGFLWTPGSGLATTPALTRATAIPPAMPARAGQHAAWVATAEGGVELLWAQDDELRGSAWAPGASAWSEPRRVLGNEQPGAGWLAGGFVPQRLADDSLVIHFIRPGPFPALASARQRAGADWQIRHAGQVQPLPGGDPVLRAPGLPLGDGGIWMILDLGDRNAIYSVSADGRLAGRQFVSAPGEHLTLLGESEVELLALLAPAEAGAARWRASADLGHRWTPAAPLQALADVAAVPLAAVRLDARDWGLLRSDASGRLFWHRSRDGGQQWQAPQELARSRIACLQRQPPVLHGGRDGVLHLVYPQAEDCRLHYMALRADGGVLNQESRDD